MTRNEGPRFSSRYGRHVRRPRTAANPSPRRTNHLSSFLVFFYFSLRAARLPRPDWERLLPTQERNVRCLNAVAEMIRSNLRMAATHEPIDN